MSCQTLVKKSETSGRNNHAVSVAGDRKILCDCPRTVFKLIRLFSHLNAALLNSDLDVLQVFVALLYGEQ